MMNVEVKELHKVRYTVKMNANGSPYSNISPRFPSRIPSN